MSDIPLEAIHNAGRIVEISSNIVRRDIRSSSIEGYTGPFDELIFPPMIPVILIIRVSLYETGSGYAHIIDQRYNKLFFSAHLIYSSLVEKKVP